jgi:hypothetical protein
LLTCRRRSAVVGGKHQPGFVLYQALDVLMENRVFLDQPGDGTGREEFLEHRDFVARHPAWNDQHAGLGNAVLADDLVKIHGK